MTDDRHIGGTAPDLDAVSVTQGQPKHRFRRRLRMVMLGAGAVAVLGLSWFAVKAVLTWRNISKNPSENCSAWLCSASATRGRLDPSKLRGEGDGRINILLIGIGGARHPGGLLADTVMVISIDPESGNAAMLSVPRDLYVTFPKLNFADKINTAHVYGETSYRATAGSGPQLLKKTVASTLDIPVHYYIRADFDGFKKIIDTVGGVDVTLERGINDPYFPDESVRSYEPFSISAGPHHLDGATALKLARSRETTSDFDRAKRQQLILKALKEKALKSENILNPKRINDLLSIVGNHVQTDLQLWEIERLIGIAKTASSGTVTNGVLETGANGLLVSGTSPYGAYILKPRTGNFEEIRAYAHSIFADPFLKQEAARVEVQNGSLRPGAAKKVASLLSGRNYNVVKIGDADRHDYKDTVIIDQTDGKKPYTINYLERRFNVKAKKASGSPEADILVIVGNSYGG